MTLFLRDAGDRFEQAYVLRALEREDWDQTRAARRLGVRGTLSSGASPSPRPMPK
jgi:hypothetical protein